MAESSNLRVRIIETLKRSDTFYRFLRAIYRILSPLPKEVLRHLVFTSRMFGLPRGFYSGVQQVRTGSREGKIILESQPVPAFPDTTLVRLSGLEQDKNQPWPVFWLLEKNAYLSGESLCLRDEKGRLMAEGTFSQAGWRMDPAYWHFASRPETSLSGNVTSVISYWGNGNYWHWLMDGISRLALLPEFPPDTQILVPPLTPWRRWFMQAMGLEERCIETSAKALLVENYYFSAPTSMTGCCNPFAIDFLRGQFLTKKTSKGDKPRRFYVVREGFTRSVHNEKELRDFFLSRGWGLVAPETLPIPEQIELFANAEAVVALHGSALTNLLWCSPGCRVIELVPDNFIAGAFEIVARLLDLPHDFIVCPADYRSHISVDINLLKQKLESAGF